MSDRMPHRIMEPEAVAAALDERLAEQANKLLRACTSNSESAVLKRGKAVVTFAVYAEAASSIAEEDSSWLEYTQTWLRDYASQAPTKREVLLRTSFFNPEMQQSLNRLVFSSAQGHNEAPLEHAAGLITGQVDITA